MDISPQAFSGFLIVAVILAAMVLAFVVDLLKGNVDQLREVAIDLKARKEAAETHIRSLELILTHSQQPALALAGGSGMHALVAPAPVQQERAMLPEGFRDGRLTMSTAAPAAEKMPAAAPAPAPTEKVRKMSPAVAAVAESVAARMANNSFRPATPAPSPAPPVAAEAKPAGEKTTLRIPIVEPVSPSAEVSKKNWNQILNTHKFAGSASGNHEVPVAAAATSSNVIAFDAHRANGQEPASLPAGLFDYDVLQKAAAEGRGFTGLAISIGMSPLERQHMGAVHGFLGSVMDATDFACWPSPDQFLLVCGDLEGEAAQRRLARVTEQLWDFQLRSMGTLDVQFAWGGKEGRGNDKLNDVVASAIGQMRETRDSRRSRTGSHKIAQAV